MKIIEEQGYIIPAWNLGGTDYVQLARRLSQTLRRWEPKSNICLLTNVDERPDNDFSHVRVVEAINTDNAWSNDWLVWPQSPYRETIKLEADMLIASDISHWWTMLRHRDLVISTGCRNWKDQDSKARNYRQCFDANNLPDVYNAVTYWRRSTTAKEFFDLVRLIFDNWNEFKKLLKYPEAVPSTDLVYACAANILGPDRVTMPFASYPKIVHMKKHHAGTQTENWTKELVWEMDPLRIQTVAQWGAFHYNIKDWA